MSILAEDKKKKYVSDYAQLMVLMLPCFVTELLSWIVIELLIFLSGRRQEQVR